MRKLGYKEAFSDYFEKNFKANSNFLGALFDKRNIYAWAVLFIVIFSAWLKLYHFTDWLHYEFDQSRDNIIVSEAIKDGLSSLPMMGPKADGTQLRVGPIYYYFEYVSALIFGDTPQGHAYFVALLSIASIPIFFLLLKRFFNSFISLGLTYLYSISFFLVLYARFGWNPNILPFFVISGIFCALMATDKKSKYPGRWFVACAVLFGIATQLHFVAFFSLPLFVIIYLLYERPKFSWKAWMACIFVVGMLYSPVIISDVVLKGHNTRELVRAFSTKTEQEKSFFEKIISTFRAGAENYALILSGDDRIWTPKINLKNGWIDLSCKNYCEKTSPWVSYPAMGFFLLGAMLAIWQIVKQKRPIAIFGLFFVVVFIILTKISTEPRFYLLATPLPFFFLGNIVDFVWQKNALIAKIIFAGVIILFSYTNISRIIQRFSDLENADKKVVSVRSDRILKEPERVSLRQFQTISEYIFDRYQENKLPVLIQSDLLYLRSFKYLTEKKGAIVGEIEKGKIYSNVNNFVILRTKRAKNISSYLEDYNIVIQQEFGTLTLFELGPKINRITELGVPLTPRSFEYIYVPWQITWEDSLKQIRQKF